jgi:hypothetical protein
VRKGVEMKRFTAVLVVGTLMILVLPTPGKTAPGPRGMATKRSAFPVEGMKPGGISVTECSVEADGAPNVKLDCDEIFPNNEPDIEVDPADPLHMIVSSNDYGTCCDEFYTSFDGGQTWETGNMSNAGPHTTGSDPVTVFDVKNETAIHPSLSYRINGNWTCDGDLVVSVSEDGGLTWEAPVQVADGTGCDLSRTQLFNDKEWIVTDNDPDSPNYGRTYLTWSQFEAHKGAYAASPILEAHSDDGGFTWSEPQEISGSNAALCTFQWTGPDGECDQNQFSVVTVGPDGTVYVAFENEQNEDLWETEEEFDDQYLLVRSTDGGAHWSTPAFVVGMEDGFRDYPRNATDRQTLTGYQLRVNSAGNVVADPTANGTLYLTFSDNRNGTHDSATPVTNVDVFLTTSTDGGTSWSGATRVDASTGDQWFPWVEVSPADGTVGVVYNDRSLVDPDLYDAALTEIGGSTTTVSTDPSDPTNSVYFQAGAEGCEECATFHGDYINISYGSDGVANVVWTDMRDFDADLDGFLQFIYFARMD